MRAWLWLVPPSHVIGGWRLRVMWLEIETKLGYRICTILTLMNLIKKFMTFLYLLRVKVHFEISPILNLSINGDIVNMVNLTETKKIIPCHTLLCQFFLNKVLMCLKFFSYELVFFYMFFTTFIPACSALFFISLVWPMSPTVPICYEKYRYG